VGAGRSAEVRHKVRRLSKLQLGIQYSSMVVFAVSAATAVTNRPIFRRASFRRRLGWNRSNMTKLLTGSRPDDPDELFIWQWTLQLCFAIVSVVLCVVALTFGVS
jgi:hypothetical protein